MGTARAEYTMTWRDGKIAGMWLLEDGAKTRVRNAMAAWGIEDVVHERCEWDSEYQGPTLQVRYRIDAVRHSVEVPLVQDLGASEESMLWCAYSMALGHIASLFAGIPFPPPPSTPELRECGVNEAVQVLVEMEGGKYWDQCHEFKLNRARKDGYVIAKREGS